MPPANVALMQQELAYLPAWYAAEGDTVFINEDLEEVYLDCLHAFAKKPIKAIGRGDLNHYSDAELCFWGISPQAIHLWEEMAVAFSVNLQLPAWKDTYIYLNSRHAAKDCLELLIEVLPEITSDILPASCVSLQEIENLLFSSSFHLLAKAPYSSSGRGLIWLPEKILTRSERQILHGILKKQQSVMIEKVLDKKIDFAMEFISDGKGKVHFAGYSLFRTNKKGAYEGNYLGSQSAIEKFISKYISVSLLHEARSKLEEILSQRYADYKGCIGVDMLIYIENGNYCLHPCLEINMRYNMGYLALRFAEKYLYSQSSGWFYLDFSSLKGEIYTRHKEMQINHPAVFENGRIKSGYFPLCPVKENSHYWAYVLVKESGGEILHTQ